MNDTAIELSKSIEHYISESMGIFEPEDSECEVEEDTNNGNFTARKTI